MFLDSSASNHIFYTTFNLQNKHSCEGPYEVLVVNVHSLRVRSIGFSMFISKLVSNSMLNLNKLLHVPRIIRYLICVPRFFKDNNLYFKFHWDTCYVIPQVSHQVLVEGFLDDSGLYYFNNLALEPLSKLIGVHPGIFETYLSLSIGYER